MSDLFHPFTDIPVNEGALGVQEIELVVFMKSKSERKSWGSNVTRNAPRRLQAAAMAVVLEECQTLKGQGTGQHT